MARMTFGHHDVAVRHGDAERVDVEHVVAGPSGLRVSVSGCDQRHAHVGARHRVDKSPSILWIGEHLFKLQVPCGQRLSEHLVDLRCDVAGRNDVSEPPPSPAWFRREAIGLFPFLCGSLVGASAQAPHSWPGAATPRWPGDPEGAEEQEDRAR
jgi:hypothetical protein